MHFDPTLASPSIFLFDNFPKKKALSRSLLIELSYPLYTHYPLGLIWLAYFFDVSICVTYPIHPDFRGDGV